MSFTHGVYRQEVATSIIAPVTGSSGLPVIIGTAKKGPVNQPVLVYSYEEAVEVFGYDNNWAKYTLYEFIYSQFALYGQAPAVLISVGETATVNKIIGGFNSRTGKAEGLELVGEVFPKYRLVPGLIGAPGWSHNPAVGIMMRAKAESVSGIFQCMAVCDAPCDSEHEVYSGIPEWKEGIGYTSNRQIVCWPKLKLGDKVFHMSTQIIGVMTRADHEREDVPYKSPSNELLQCDGCTDDEGNEINLGMLQANYLNGQGIMTALNWIGGWRSWGNRTAAFPSTTDPKDCFIPVRRMFDYIGNEFVLTFWQNVDQPLTVRLVREIVSTYNIRLNGLQAREMILGGRIEFKSNENALTDLMNGVLRFHVYMTPPVPAETIEAILEYDPEYLNALFGALTQ